MTRRMWMGGLLLALNGCIAATEQDAASTGTKPDAESSVVYGSVFDLGSDAVPATMLGAVEVCANGDHCTMTENGRYALDGLQPNSRFELSFRKAGYVTALVHAGVNAESGNAVAGLLSATTANAFAAAAGAPALGETGGVVVMIMKPTYGTLEPLAGGTFSVHASHPTRAIYASDRGLADSTIERTSSAGWGAVLGIAPGTIAVDGAYDAGGMRCGSWSEQAPELLSPTEVRVRAGELTVVTIVCANTATP